jgi:hypothetical protein
VNPTYSAFRKQSLVQTLAEAFGQFDNLSASQPPSKRTIFRMPWYTVLQ